MPVRRASSSMGNDSSASGSGVAPERAMAQEPSLACCHWSLLHRAMSLVFMAGSEVLTAASGAANQPPAGGSSLDQVLIASGAAAAMTAVLLVLGVGHRTGRLTLLTRLADRSERSAFSQGHPGWAGLPLGLALISLLTALFGMMWDIALHIGVGRDEGPLANAAHYPILFGLFGIFAAGALACVLPKDGVRPGPASVRITRDWYAPTGGLLLAGSGFYALFGFPLDDVWHRIFGQDVTLWGPTHLMLIGGAGLSLVGMAVLSREGQLAAKACGFDPENVTDRRIGAVVFARRGAMMGGLLIGLSVFQAEFDFGVPQFRLVFQPLLIAVAASVALVAARLWIGRGGAIAAVAFYLLIRGGVSLAVGPVIGHAFPGVPLYLAEAVLVELAAFALASRPLAFGAVSGVLIGTGGFAAEYAWSAVAFPLRWTSDILVEGVLMAVVGGVAGGIAGALLVLGLWGRLPRPAVARPLYLGSVLAVALAVANGLIITVPSGSASMTLTEAGRTEAGNRQVNAEVRLNPTALAASPAWLTMTSWRGKGDGTGLVVDRLEKAGDGVYRTSEPIPVEGNWKSLVRLQDGRELGAVPLYMPADDALGVPEVSATAQVDRPLQREILILQRERKSDVPGWLWSVANLVVLACSLTLLLALGWGVTRLSRSTGESDRIDPKSATAGFRPGAVRTRTPVLRPSAPGPG